MTSRYGVANSSTFSVQKLNSTPSGLSNSTTVVSNYTPTIESEDTEPSQSDLRLRNHATYQSDEIACDNSISSSPDSFLGFLYHLKDFPGFGGSTLTTSNDQFIVEDEEHHMEFSKIDIYARTIFPILFTTLNMIYIFVYKYYIDDMVGASIY